jgi:hypothetical protein
MKTLLASKIKKYPKKLKREIQRLPLFQARADKRYYELLEQHTPSLPQLNAKEDIIFARLWQEGTYITSVDKFDIGGTDLMFEVATNIANKLRLDTQQNSFNYPAINLTKSHLVKYPEIFLWGLEEKLLNLVENYIGLPIIYQGLSLRQDIADGESVGVRKWHLDWEDRRVIKIIIYLNDVDTNCGPYEYIPKKLTTTAMSNLKYYDLGFFSDREMEAAIPKSNWQTCTGKAGTIIISDTCNIFHHLKPPITTDRFSLTFCYTSERPQVIWEDKLFIKDKLSLIGNKMNQRQKNCLRELR